MFHSSNPSKPSHVVVPLVFNPKRILFFDVFYTALKIGTTTLLAVVFSQAFGHVLSFAAPLIALLATSFTLLATIVHSETEFLAYLVGGTMGILFADVIGATDFLAVGAATFCTIYILNILGIAYTLPVAVLNALLVVFRRETDPVINQIIDRLYTIFIGLGTANIVALFFSTSPTLLFMVVRSSFLRLYKTGLFVAQGALTGETTAMGVVSLAFQSLITNISSAKVQTELLSEWFGERLRFQMIIHNFELLQHTCVRINTLLHTAQSIAHSRYSLDNAIQAFREKLEKMVATDVLVWTSVPVEGSILIPGDEREHGGCPSSPSPNMVSNLNRPLSSEDHDNNFASSIHDRNGRSPRRSPVYDMGDYNNTVLGRRDTIGDATIATHYTGPVSQFDMIVASPTLDDDIPAPIVEYHRTPEPRDSQSMGIDNRFQFHDDDHNSPADTVVTATSPSMHSYLRTAARVGRSPLDSTRHTHNPIPLNATISEARQDILSHSEESNGQNTGSSNVAISPVPSFSISTITGPNVRDDTAEIRVSALRLLHLSLTKLIMATNIIHHLIHHIDLCLDTNPRYELRSTLDFVHPHISKEYMNWLSDIWHSRTQSIVVAESNIYKALYALGIGDVLHTEVQHIISLASHETNLVRHGLVMVCELEALLSCNMKQSRYLRELAQIEGTELRGDPIFAAEVFEIEVLQRYATHSSYNDRESPAKHMARQNNGIVDNKLANRRRIQHRFRDEEISRKGTFFQRKKRTKHHRERNGYIRKERQSEHGVHGGYDYVRSLRHPQSEDDHLDSETTEWEGDVRRRKQYSMAMSMKRTTFSSALLPKSQFGSTAPSVIDTGLESDSLNNIGTSSSDNSGSRTSDSKESSKKMKDSTTSEFSSLNLNDNSENL